MTGPDCGAARAQSIERAYADRQIEVYTKPTGPTASLAYEAHADDRAGDVLPLLLDGDLLGQVPVVELLP